jgi:hypothetical protein
VVPTEEDADEHQQQDQDDDHVRNLAEGRRQRHETGEDPPEHSGDKHDDKEGDELVDHGNLLELRWRVFGYYFGVAAGAIHAIIGTVPGPK